MNHQWPPEVVRAMHQFADAAPVAPSLGSVLEQRQIAPSSQPLAADLHPEQRLAPMEEMIVSDDPATNEGRNRRRLVMAAAAVVVVIGVAGIGYAVGTNSLDDEAPADAPPIAVTTIAPTTVAPTTVAPTTETGVFVGSEGDVPWTVTMPAGWENSGWGVVTGSPLFGFVTAQVGNIYADPCQWESVPPFGPTVDDLVAAWANVPGFDATATTDVTVDGYAGKQIEFTVPNFNEDQCKDGRYGIWQEAIAIGDGGPNYWAQGPNQHNQVWILDVDGTRLVILASYFPDTSPQDRAVLDQMLASIEIG